MPRIKFDPDARVNSAPAKKDTIRWCKGVVGREHVKVWRSRREHYLTHWEELACINCDKRFDNRVKCEKCGQYGCGGHRAAFRRQRRKYPRPMSSDFRKPKSFTGKK